MLKRRPVGNASDVNRVPVGWRAEEVFTEARTKRHDQSFAKEKNMNRYLIETPHTASECLDLIKVLNAQGYLRNFDWGCEAGTHSGWAIVDAGSEVQARLAVPPLVRPRARIIKLNKFDATTIRDHEKRDATLHV
jgi:hypothetical protein